MFDSITIARNARATDTQAIVFGYFGEKGANQGLDPRTKARVAGLGLSDILSEALARTEATGDAGSLVETFTTAAKTTAKGAKEATVPASTRILLVGLGSRESFEAGAMRLAAATVARRLAAVKGRVLRTELEGVLEFTKVDAALAGTAFGEGLGLIGWVCDQFRGKATTDPKRTRLTVVPGEGDFANGLAKGLALAESANYCRTLSQTPPNIATPDFLAKEAQRLGRKTGLSVKVWEGDDLVREKFEGLINVGKASENLPRMIRLEYNPKGASKGGKPIVLIGKAMTYDTGGLSLKISNGMVGMKRDKDGGCAVLGAMHAIATVIKPRRKVVAFLASAENSISDEAYRPDDVLTFRNGVTVEVTNTDAEGRLVLADALVYACEKENPAYIVDLATLTGGVVVALGSTYCGMFCEDDKLRAKIEAAAAVSGERVWRLPMHAEYREMMKSPVADILNSNPNRKAHPIQGAAFLSYFVDEKIPWCHLDIAGVHVSEKNAGVWVDGPTGWGVRLLANLLDAE